MARVIRGSLTYRLKSEKRETGRRAKGHGSWGEFSQIQVNLGNLGNLTKLHQKKFQARLLANAGAFDLNGGRSGNSAPPAFVTCRRDKPRLVRPGQTRSDLRNNSRRKDHNRLWSHRAKATRCFHPKWDERPRISTNDHESKSLLGKILFHPHPSGTMNTFASPARAD